MIPAQRGRALCSCRQWLRAATQPSLATAPILTSPSRRTFSYSATTSLDLNANTDGLGKPLDSAHLRKSDSAAPAQPQSQQSSSFPTQTIWETPPPREGPLQINEVTTLLSEIGSNRTTGGAGRHFQNTDSANGGGGADNLTKNIAEQLNINHSPHRFPGAKPKPHKNRNYKNLRLSPSLGRSVEVETNINPVGSDKARLTGAAGRAAQQSAFAKAQGQDLTKAFRVLEIQCSMNKVKQQQREQKFHVRRGQKRKEVKMRRWRKLFKDSFKTTIGRCRLMMNQGW